MKPFDGTPIEPAADALDDLGSNHKQNSVNGRKRGPAGLSADAKKLSQHAAALEQRARLSEEQTRRAFERIWILLRLASGGLIFTLLQDSRHISDDDRRWLVEETGAPKNLIKGEK